MQPVCGRKCHGLAKRLKLSRAAETVNREHGTSWHGVTQPTSKSIGAGDLLRHLPETASDAICIFINLDITDF